MRGSAGKIILILSLAVAGLLAGCGAPVAQWKYKKTIAKPLSARVGRAPVALGNLDKNKVLVTLPGKTFDGVKKVTLSTPDSVPPVPNNKFIPLGSPVEISSIQKRENRPIEITMKLDARRRRDLRTGAIKVIYYNGKDWDAIEPVSVDPARTTLTFQSYHMSVFGAAKIDAKERISAYVNSKAIGEVAQDNIDEIVDRNIKENLETLMKDGLGMNDRSVKFKVISSLLNDDEYRNIVDKLRAGDAEGFNKDLMVFMGKKIAEEVEDSILKNVLEHVSSKEGVGYMEAFSQAAGFIAEKDFRSAGEVIAQQIADNSTVAKLFKGSAEIVQYNIDLWQKDEIDAAYQAYRDGADDGYWGYDVEKGRFDQVYNQMKGIAVKIEGDYVRREMARRESLSMRPATEAELAKIRDRARRDLQAQFKTRLKHDDEVAKKAARKQQLIDKFTEAKLLEGGSFGYNADYDKLEDRLDQLVKLSEKILKDTKRKDWSTASVTNERTISLGDMVSLMQAWYSKNGKTLYAEMLKDKFGISNLAGIEGGFTLVPVPAPPVAAGADYGNQVFALLAKKTRIEIKNNQVAHAYKDNFAVPNGGFAGNGWMNIKGTYDPKTSMLNVQMDWGWDGQGTFNGIDLKDKSTYSGTGQQKIEPTAKKVVVPVNYSMNSSKFARADEDWGPESPYSQSGVWNIDYNLKID